jgi:DNA mismatch endonuclease (patch repair protein)
VNGESRSSWASSPGTRASMRANKSRDTKPELALRRTVHARGMRYRVGIRPVATLRRTADLVFTKVRVAVFLDGCFWHGCPQHHSASKTNPTFWANKVRKNRERDIETDRLLAEHGWTVIRIWEHEDPVAAAKRIEALVFQLGGRPGSRPIAGPGSDRQP